MPTSRWALGDRISRYSGNDIRVNGFTAADFLARIACELVHEFTAVLGALATIQLRITFGHSLSECRNPLFLRLHASNGIADDLGGIAIEAAGDLALA
jgi:hypothetical protein